MRAFIKTPNGILEKTFGYKPHYAFATDDSGRLVPPIFEIRSRLTGSRLCSVPFSHECGPIGDAETVSMLLDYELESFVESKVKYIEIRDMVHNNRFESQNYFSTYVLDLSIGLENIWANLKKDVRRGINNLKNTGRRSFRQEILKIQNRSMN